jgi:hypothetical protein
LFLLRYHELDPYKSLSDNLKDKVIIEYPTLHVVLRGSSNDKQLLQGKQCGCFVPVPRLSGNGGLECLAGKDVLADWNCEDVVYCLLKTQEIPEMSNGCFLSSLL